MLFEKKHAAGQWIETAVLLLGCMVLLSGVWAQAAGRELSDRLIRLHVIASSDSEADQTVKLAVRDAVLSFVEPRLSQASDAGAAEELLRASLGELEALAGAVSGQSARAELSREAYPTRKYGDFSLPAGVYTSLRITLGEGAGRNWWCVVYPMLCSSGPETAREAAALLGEDARLLWDDGEGWEVRFRVLEWWGALLSRLEGEK